MRILGIDIGTRRVGVAVSDPTGLIAQSLTVIPRRSWAQVVAAVAEVIQAHGVERVVVGLPLRLGGGEGEAAAAARRFAARLQDAVGIPVVLEDERLSTAEAERVMRQADAGRSTRRARRDAVAAALILQRHLDRGRPSDGRDPRPNVDPTRGGEAPMTHRGNVITMLDDEGLPHDFTLVDVLEVNGRRYAVLQPDDPAAGAVLFRLEGEMMTPVDDDEEFAQVVAALRELGEYDGLLIEGDSGREADEEDERS